jgi:hypothetical protein
MRQFEMLFPHERAFPKDERKTILKPDGLPKADRWGSSRECYVRQPLNPIGDFAAFSTYGPAVRTEAFSRAKLGRFFLPPYVETLPMRDPDHQIDWFFLNTIHVVNVIDIDKSEVYKTGSNLRLEFLVGRLPHHNVFTLWKPESLRSMMFCVSQYDDPDQELKARVEAHGLTGLEFDLMWDENQGGVMHGSQKLANP